MECEGVHVEVYKVVMGPKPWPRILRWSTYHNLVADVSAILKALCTCLFCCGHPNGFMCLYMSLFYGWLTIFVLILCLEAGYHEPTTELRDLAIHNLNVTQNAISPNIQWELNGDIVVTFEARNPSTVAGYTNKYFYTIVSASYGGTMFGQSVIPTFSEGHHTTQNVSAELKVDHLQLSQNSGLALEGELLKNVIALEIEVDARVIQKLLTFRRKRWFNFTCSVNVSAPSAFQPGHMLSKSCNHTKTPLPSD